LAAHPGTVVAVVSGRSLADLRPRVGVEDVVYVGNHGLEIDRGGPPRVHPQARQLAPTIAEVCRKIEQATGGKGVIVEDKRLTATIHHADADPDTHETVEAIVDEAVDQHALRRSPGKGNVEIRPDVVWDKGSAMRELVADAPDGWRPIYLGDDETDEDAFRALDGHGITIHVGDEGPTAARYRIPNPAQVAGFLNGLAAEIHGEVTKTNGASSHLPAVDRVVEERAMKGP
jgi:trehalose 6-phosphate phosphatase